MLRPARLYTMHGGATGKDITRFCKPGGIPCASCPQVFPAEVRERRLQGVGFTWQRRESLWFTSRPGIYKLHQNSHHEDYEGEGSSLPWEKAREAVRAAWDRLEGRRLDAENESGVPVP